jgi:integrase
MQTHNPRNERIKREYLVYFKEARRHSEASLDAVASALHRFETYTKFRDFRQFHIDQAIGFKKHLAAQPGRHGKGLSEATLYSTLMALKSFFRWLAGQPGYKSRLRYTDAEYFNLSEKETRVAKTHREQRSPTLEQIRHVLHVMPQSSEIEQRNRALIAFAILTGARDSALASLQLGHVDQVEGLVYQDARAVKTKFSKSITTYFFPVGDDIRAIVDEWLRFLREDKLWGNDDPLFPATQVSVGPTGGFQANGLAHKPWASAGPIRDIYKEAFTGAGLRYYNPHSFRRTLVLFGQKVCRTPEEFKAWSQNLGHENVLTTFTSYGTLSTRHQGDVIKGISGAGGG